MRTRHKPWREAVVELLDVADISQRMLADEIGLPRPNITRWLSGGITPTAVNMRAVNKALSSLTDSLEIEAYLSVAAIMDGMETFHGSANPSKVHDANTMQMVSAATQLLSEFEGFFDASLVETLIDLFKNDPGKAIGLCAFLAHIRGRQIVARFQGVATRGTYFDEVAVAFKVAGLASLIRSDATTDILRARDRTRIKIERMLSRAVLPTSERMGLGKKLRALTDEVFSAILSSSAGRHDACLAAIATELSHGASSRRKGTHK